MTIARLLLVFVPALLLALFLTAFFWQVTFRHEVLSGGDLIYTTYPWAPAPPPDYGEPENIYQSDDAFLGYPSRYVLFQGLKDEGLFDWQPFHLSGTPTSFPTDFLGYAFYPPAWLYFFLPFYIANSAFHLVVLFVAGLGMYLLLRQLRLPQLSALYGALLFMVNGHFIVWLGAVGLPAILGLVPLMIFGFERFQERRQPVYLLIPAVCLAIQIYLGYAPGWVVSGGVLVIYGLVRLAPSIWARRYGDGLRQVGAYAATAGLGLLLAAYSLFPTLSASFVSGYQTSRQGGLEHIPLESAWTYLLPNYWGSPEIPIWLSPFGGNYPEWVAYFGISAAPLALLGLWHLRRSWVAWFALGVLAFSSAQVYGIPPLKALSHLPGLEQTGATRWHYGVPLAASILAPLGLALLTGDEASPRARRLLAVGIALAVLIAPAALALLAIYRGDTDMWRFVTEDHGLILHPSNLFDQLRSSFSHLHRQLFFLLGSGALVVLTLLVQRQRIPLLALTLVVMTLIDLFSFGSAYNATVRKADLYPETPGLAFMRSDEELFRIAPISVSVLLGYTANIYGLETITGYDHYRDQEYVAFLGPILSPSDVQLATGSGFITIGYKQPLNPNVLALLNVKYVVFPHSIKPMEPWLLPVYQGTDLTIFQPETTLPRAWGVGATEVLPTRQAVLDRIASDTFDPANAVVFATQDLPQNLAQATSGVGGTFRAQITDYNRDSLTAHTDFSQPGFLVLSERFHQGWQAEIDGSHATVLRADGLLRAIAVGPGQHIVRLSFHPWEYVWGARVSLITAGLTGLALALFLVRFAWRSLSLAGPAQPSVDLDGER